MQLFQKSLKSISTQTLKWLHYKERPGKDPKTLERENWDNCIKALKDSVNWEFFTILAPYQTKGAPPQPPSASSHEGYHTVLEVRYIYECMHKIQLFNIIAAPP